MTASRQTTSGVGVPGHREGGTVGQTFDLLAPPRGQLCRLGERRELESGAGAMVGLAGHYPGAQLGDSPRKFAGKERRGNPRTARNRRGIAWKGLAVHHRQGRLAPAWRRARRGNRPATRQAGQSTRRRTWKAFSIRG